MERIRRRAGDLKNVMTFRATNTDVLQLEALATIRSISPSEVLRGLIRSEASRQARSGRTG